jgi:hypothetical protein
MSEEPPIGIIIKSKGKKEEIIVPPYILMDIISKPSIVSIKNKFKEHRGWDYQLIPSWKEEEGWGSEKLVFDTEKKSISGIYNAPHEEDIYVFYNILKLWQEKGWKINVKTDYDNVKRISDFWGVSSY